MNAKSGTLMTSKLIFIEMKSKKMVAPFVLDTIMMEHKKNLAGCAAMTAACSCQ
jgi:hypothetical protein